MKAQTFSLDKHLLLQFGNGLQEQRREFLQTIEKAETEIRDFAGPAPVDAIDLSCFTAAKESLFARASRGRRLRLIQRALERITDGSFGICLDCDAAIGLEGLQAVPELYHERQRTRFRPSTHVLPQRSEFARFLSDLATV